MSSSAAFKYYIIGFNHSTEQIAGISVGNTSILSGQLAGLGFEVTQDENTADLIIFLANNRFFYKPEILHELRKKYRPVSQFIPQGGRVRFDENYKYKPILTLYSGKVFRNNEGKMRLFGLKYWDSSIWQRWVDIGGIKGRTENETTAYEERLDKALKYIRWNLQEKKYEDPTAKEFCEFVTRVYLNAYLVEVGKSTGHAGAITPFPFFEETKMIDRERVPHRQLITLQQFRWRILLVNDKKESLDHHEKLLKSSCFIDPAFTVSVGKEASNTVLTLEYANSIDDAINLLNERNFDIIILDYLLGNKPGSKKRELGIEFFIRISDIKKRGAQGKCWVLLASSFSSAFMDHLREEGYSFYSENWVIQRGADPINTPNAFLYNLVSLLENQLKRTSKEGNKLSRMWMTAVSGLKTSFDKSWALRLQNQVFSYWSEMQELSMDASKETGSLFATSFLKVHEVNKEFENGLFSYIVHFLNLMIFSDGFEWEEMLTDLEKIIELTNTHNVPQNKLLYSHIKLLRSQHDRV